MCSSSNTNITSVTHRRRGGEEKERRGEGEVR
jgi:hypothetical protein